MDDLPDGAGILTHCNAGALVSGSGDGTALAVIFELARRGKHPHVLADETRPLLQGARLTMWELPQRGIDATLICDSVAAQVMREGRIQAVITGADRIAANGDTANKIGTFSVATLARCTASRSTSPRRRRRSTCRSPPASEIPIEQRAAEEITGGFGTRTAPAWRERLQPGVRCHAGRADRGDHHRPRRGSAGEYGRDFGRAPSVAGVCDPGRVARSWPQRGQLQSPLLILQPHELPALFAAGELHD